MNKAVFLDRDGVLNAAIIRDGKPYPPNGLPNVRILPGVREAVQMLRNAGFSVAVVTNQPDVARGTQTIEVVESINRFIGAETGVEYFYVCTHDDADHCACRKPLPGLMHRAAADHLLDLSRSFLVGDRWRDIAAGLAAGCRTVWIDYGYNEKAPIGHDFCTQSLLQASEWICKQDEVQLIKR